MSLGILLLIWCLGATLPRAGGRRYVRQKRRLREIRHNVFEWWQGRARLGTCPIAFYAEVLRGLTYNKVWVVANPHARAHGTVQKLVHRFDAEVFGGADAADDFRFLARARTVILSGSFDTVLDPSHAVSARLHPGRAVCNILDFGSMLVG